MTLQYTHTSTNIYAISLGLIDSTKPERFNLFRSTRIEPVGSSIIVLSGTRTFYANSVTMYTRFLVVTSEEINPYGRIYIIWDL